MTGPSLFRRLFRPFAFPFRRTRRLPAAPSSFCRQKALLAVVVQLGQGVDLQQGDPSESLETGAFHHALLSSRSFVDCLVRLQC